MIAAGGTGGHIYPGIAVAQEIMRREEIALVEEDFPSPEDVDAAARFGYGFRYIAAGPLLQRLGRPWKYQPG